MSENEQDKRLEETAGEEPAKEEKSGREAYEWVQALVCSVLAVVVLFTFVIRLIGEYRYGDIVIIQKGTFADGDPIVKRVIATEGQTVDIDFANGIVYVDGEALDEPYINEPTYTDEGTEFPLTVPEGSIFVMGDNRNRSDDSRNAELGTVDTRYVIGRAVFLLFPGADEATGKRNFGRIGLIGGVEA